MNKVHNRTTGAMRVPLQIQTCLCPVEQRGQLPAIWKARFGVAQFVEEAMGTRFQRRDSSPRRVFEETRDERDGFYRCTWSENLSSIRMFKWLQVTSNHQVSHSTLEAKYFHDMKVYSLLLPWCTTFKSINIRVSLFLARIDHFYCKLIMALSLGLATIAIQIWTSIGNLGFLPASAW